MRNMEQKRAYIYGLTDEHGTVRYVGKSVDVARRFADHLSERNRKFPVYAWIKKQQRNNAQVRLVVLASALGPDWQSLEKAVIKQYRDDGFKLLNVADGGDEPHVTLEQRRALGRKLKCPLHTRQENGRKVFAAIQADPARAELHRLRLRLSQDWRKGLLPEAVKNRLVEAAFMNPESLWCFVKLAAKHG